MTIEVIQHTASSLNKFESDPIRTQLRVPLMLYLVAFADAELVTAFGSELWGIIFHFVILALLIINSTIAGRHPSCRLFLALGLIPLLRIASFTVPVALMSEIYWYLMIGIAMLIGAIGAIRTLEIDPKDVGLTRGKIPIQSLIAIVGIGFGLVDYYILDPDPLITSLTFQKVLLPALILLVSTGFVEELVFRGVLQHTTKVIVGWGWVYIAILYAVLQIGHGSMLHCVFAFAVALFFGWVVKRTGSILGVSISHGVLNVGLYLVFPHVL